jgi:hypothetical protein
MQINKEMMMLYLILLWHLMHYMIHGQSEINHNLSSIHKLHKLSNKL